AWPLRGEVSFQTSDDYASRSHFARKLFFAAPVRALPFLSTALGSHASRLHFCRKLVFAAPTSALPFLSTALLSQFKPCAIAAPSSANEATTIALRSFVMGRLPGPDNRATRSEFPESGGLGPTHRSFAGRTVARYGPSVPRAMWGRMPPSAHRPTWGVGHV